jgi:O-antigen ligase
LHIPGLLDLNQTGSFPRLQEPLGYWNALALFIAYGTPLALARAADPARTARARAVPLLVLQLMLIAIGLTYSRGGLIALAIGLGIGIAVSGRWLPSLTWLAVAAIAAAPPLAYGLASHSLSTGGVSLASRQVAGLILLVVLALSSAVMLFGASRLRALEAERPLTPEGTRRVGRMLVALVGTALVAGVLAVSFSGRGLTGTVSHAWSSFTTTRVTSNTNPERLLSANSENRWVWWKEAAGAFSDRPIAGWGAGSFPVVHLLYRRNGLSVNQPHSVPLQFLSETGLVGTAVVALAFVLLIVAALRGVRRAGSGTERLVASALFAGVVMFLVHGLYDWDWDIPAMAIPALVFVGILCGGEGADRVGRLGYAARTAGVALVTLSACAFALSAALPSWAATKASDAIVQAAGSEADVSHAEATAALAARLDPLSNAGLLVEATIAARRGQIARVRSLLISATRRDPTDATAWFQLAFADLSVGDAKAASQAGRRALALDPYSSRQAALLQGIKRSEKRTGARPAASATAVPVRSP